MYSLIWFLRAQVSTLSPPVLEVMDVDFKYPTGPTILRDVNFGLDQSSRVCIVGPNGAGARTAATASLSLLLFCVSSSRLVSSPLGVRSLCRRGRSRLALLTAGGFVLASSWSWFLLSSSSLSLVPSLLYARITLSLASLSLLFGTTAAPACSLVLLW